MQRTLKMPGASAGVIAAIGILGLPLGFLALLQIAGIEIPPDVWKSSAVLVLVAMLGVLRLEGKLDKGLGELKLFIREAIDEHVKDYHHQK